MLRFHGFEIVDYVESSLVSDWKLEREMSGDQLSLPVKLACLVFRLLPVRKELSTVRVRKAPEGCEADSG